MKKSNFLTKTDCGPGILVTVSGCKQENVALPGAPEELRWCLFFKEQEKPMVLNTTNAQIIAAVCGSENTDDWNGRKIVLYNDPNISFQGKLVGGIRARAPRIQSAALSKAAPEPVPAPARPPPAPCDELGVPLEETPF